MTDPGDYSVTGADKKSDLGGQADADAGDNCSCADISPETERNPTDMCDSV